MYSLFDMNGQPLPSSSRYAIIKDKNVSACFMNTTDMWNRFNFSDSPQIAMVAIQCVEPVRLHMLPYEGRHYQNVISYVQIGNCNTTVSDWNQLSVATDMRVITFIMNDYGQECNNRTPVVCVGLQNAVSFVYTNKEETSANLSHALSCLPVYPEMAEIEFKNMSWTDLPSEFTTLFPNLQSLSVPLNNFTVPPSIFPWTTQEHYLPRNLSRSIYMAHHYSVSINLDISANKYRRLFNLAQNKIQNLTDFSFHGYLHMINLNGNGMLSIGEDVFQNVTGLQHLDLSNNKLTSLPVGIFRGLTGLRHLDLSANRFDTLSVGIFDDLTSLRYLSLANNSLSALKPGLLTHLRQLEVLHLEYNLLTSLSTHSYPIDSVVLREAYFHNNPIKSLPEFIFWIRSLSHVDLHKTEIRFDNLTAFIKNMDKNRLASSIIDSASDTDFEDLKHRSHKLRVIDLSGCKIRSLYLEEINTEMKNVIILFLLHFKFVLTNNPINCNCKIIPLSNLVQALKENGTVASNEYYFKEWICQYPQELQNRPLLGVKNEETYCFVENLSGCPTECKCYNRSVSGNVIVDCRDLKLTKIHDYFPEGTLELWYGGNNISFVGPNRFMKHVRVLDVSMNSVTGIHAGVFKQAWKLKELFLQSNLLTYLPKSVEGLGLNAIKLSQNNFHCDCHSLWMKHWILRNRHVILGWNELSCSNKATGRKLIDVNDSDFVCKEEFDSVRDVIIPSVTCSVILCLLVISGVLVYAYRLECKVLMYVYLGVHPFDRDADSLEESLDCVIVHSGATTDWVMNNIVNILESNDYRFVVCDMARDFVVGFSMQENLTCMVRHSKRIIFCMSSDWEQSNESFKLAWNIAQEKIKETRSNYGIIVNHGLERNKVTDKELLRLMKRGRFIDSSKRLFVEKVIYSMPRKEHREQYRDREEQEMYSQRITTNTRHIPISFIETEDDILSEVEPSSPGIHMHRCHAYISYSDDDTDYVVHNLTPLLESKGYVLCIPDRDFIPGAPKEENILAAINASKRTLFILSRSHIFDEWSLFAFRNACEKSLREKTNHLIVIIRDDVDIDSLDKEVRHYLKTYVSLNVNDRWFEQKLFNGLPLLKHSKQLHTSPLFTTSVEVDNVAFQISE